MRHGQSHIIQTLALTTATSAATPDLISVSSFVKSGSFPAVSAHLSPELVLLFHRLTCFDLPSRAIGQLRTRDVWLGNLEGRVATHVQPPSPEQVADLLAALCENWRKNFGDLRNQALKLEAIATFHAKLLLIHPFLDGNGRVARAILMQQCLDLFGKADMSLMGKGADYYSALQAADANDYRPLIALIAPVIRK
jgi:Fic family protein